MLKDDEFVSQMMAIKTYAGGIKLLKEYGFDVTIEELMVPADIGVAKMYEYGFTPQ